jgi:hypothetical protein
MPSSPVGAMLTKKALSRVQSGMSKNDTSSMCLFKTTKKTNLLAYAYICNLQD